MPFRSRVRVVLVVLLTALAGCSGSPKEPVEAASKNTEPPEIRVARAEIRRVNRSISVTGSLHPDETATVSSEVAGRVLRVNVDFGHSVRKGQVLVELDPQEYRIQVERSRAALAQALARLGMSPADEIKPPESTPGVRQALAQLEDAKFKFESAARLVKSGDISQERYNELEKTYRARQAALDAARDELRTHWASMEALRAEVRLAEKRVSDCVMRAPFDGSVSERLATAGQFVKENAPVMTLVKAHPLRLRAEVPESAVGAVRTGTPLAFTTDAVPGVEFQASVRELNPSLDARSRSLVAEARLNSADPRLRPGMFVQVRLVVARDAEVVAVPKAAIYSVAGLTKLFVIRDGKAVECRIPPGEDLGDWVEVPKSQVNAGEAVAIERLGSLVNGATVRTRS